jgi:hypothetical protein
MPIEVGGDCGAIAMKTSPATVTVLLALAIPAQFGLEGRAAAQDRPIRLAQAADTTTTTPGVTPVTPSSSSATCLSGCSSQSLNCQNTCIATVNGTTVVPSMTSVGVTTDPNRCAMNCTTQQTQCQRACSLEQ